MNVQRDHLVRTGSCKQLVVIATLFLGVEEKKSPEKKRRG